MRDLEVDIVGPSFLSSGGEAAALMRNLDELRSPIGSPSAWPASLRSVVGLMLGSKFPMFVAWGPELAFLYNDAYAPILSAKHPMAMGQPFQEVWSEIWSDVGPLAHRALAGEPTWLEDLPLTMHRKGFDESTWFTFSYSPVRDEDGRIAGMFCACTETTNAVVAKRALRESEAQLRLAIDGAKIGTWDWDMRTVRGSWSPRTMEILGVAQGNDVSPQQRNDTIHPDDRERVWQEVIEATNTGRDLISEYRIVRPDGEQRWIASRGAIERNDAGSPVRSAGIVIDITDNKAAEDSAREDAAASERERLWSLSQDMLARADYSGNMSAVSPAWKSVLGWEERELLARDYESLMHPDDTAATMDAIEAMRATDKPARFENRIATEDGGWKSIEWIVAPEPDGENFIAIGRDLSEAKTREAALKAAQEALRQSQKMEAMGSLTGGVAHDFNNLLTPIIGSLDLLKRKGVGTEREQKLIDGAMQSADRAKTLVQRLLAFARRQPLQPVAVNIVRLVNDMAGLIGSTTGPQIRVVVETASDLPAATADQNQLEMALLNLAVNARDAMPDGGTLRITASERLAKDRPINLQPGRYVCLSVADTGSGMDADTMRRAIEPFFSTKGVGKGTGLGLSMVHGLASQLGGTLVLHSHVGTGTNVELWLPVSALPAEERASLETTTSPRVGAGTALLVDDEDLVRMSTADMLSELGYDVVETGSAEQALRLMREGLQIELLVTDHLMPGMTGSELARILRVQNPGLGVLIISGYAESEGVAPDLLRLTKPFRSDELAQALAMMEQP